MTKNIVIAILLVVVILFLFTKPVYNKGTITFIHDTVYQQKTFTQYKKGNNIYSYVIKTDSVQNYVHDTVKIISDYSRVYAYLDTINIDTNNVVYVQDTISQNRILGRGFSAKLSEKTVYVTKTIQPKDRSALYFGFMFDLRQSDRQLGIGIGGAFKTAKKGIVTANATTNGYSLGYYLKF
jgi:hypothetical protein